MPHAATNPPYCAAVRTDAPPTKYILDEYHALEQALAAERACYDAAEAAAAEAEDRLEASALRIAELIRDMDRLEEQRMNALGARWARRGFDHE